MIHPTPSEISFETKGLLGYRDALLVLFPTGSNIREPHPGPGTLSRVNRAFMALLPTHKRRLERLRCTIDRLAYIERATQS